MRRFIPAPALALTLLASSGLAEPRDTVAADALFRDGRALMKQKKLAEACPKLAESYRLDPAVGTLFNLAQCEEDLGRLAHAFERWQAVVDALSVGGKLADKRLPVARQHVADLDKKVPRLTLRIKKGSPEDTIVLRDGVEIRGAGLGTPLPVDPGDHTLLARAAYKKDGVTKVTLAPGDAKELEVAPGEEDGTRPKPPPPTTAAPPATSSAPPPPKAPPPASSTAPRPVELTTSGSSRRTMGYVALGVGGLGILGGGVTALLLSSKQSTVDEHCSADTKRCDAEGASAASSGRTLLKVNTALFAVGVVGAGVGTYLVVTSDGRRTTGLTLAPTVGGAAVGWGGTL